MVNKSDHILLGNNLKILVKELYGFEDLKDNTISMIFKDIWVTVYQVNQYLK
jgi:hypothetical protein